MFLRGSRRGGRTRAQKHQRQKGDAKGKPKKFFSEEVWGHRAYFNGFGLFGSEHIPQNDAAPIQTPNSLGSFGALGWPSSGRGICDAHHSMKDWELPYSPPQSKNRRKQVAQDKQNEPNKRHKVHNPQGCALEGQKPPYTAQHKTADQKKQRQQDALLGMKTCVGTFRKQKIGCKGRHETNESQVTQKDRDLVLILHSRSLRSGLNEWKFIIFSFGEELQLRARVDYPPCAVNVRLKARECERTRIEWALCMIKGERI